MSLMDTVSQFLGDSGKSPAQSLVEMLANHPDGANGLVQKFQDNGLGHIVSSWLGSGSNLPVSAEQIQTVFGNPQIAAFANKCGISPDVASSKIAELLPSIIDRLSPNGSLPAGNDFMSKAAGLLKGELTKNA